MPEDWFPVPFPKGIFEEAPLEASPLENVPLSGGTLKGGNLQIVSTPTMSCGDRGVSCAWGADMKLLGVSYALARLGLAPKVFSGTSRTYRWRGADGRVETVLDEPARMARRSLVVEKFNNDTCGPAGRGVVVVNMDISRPTENPVESLFVPDPRFSYLFRMKAWPEPGSGNGIVVSLDEANCIDADVTKALFASNTAWHL